MGDNRNDGVRVRAPPLRPTTTPPRGIADDIRPVVQDYLDSCDRCAEELLDWSTARPCGLPQCGDPG